MANGLRVWASGPISPGPICADARTPGPSGASYPEGTEQGQFGWDIGLGFLNTGDLADKLAQAVSSYGRGIDRLAITVHGTAGHLDVDGKIGAGALSASARDMTGQQVNDELNSKTFCMQTFDSYAPGWRRVGGQHELGRRHPVHELQFRSNADRRRHSEENVQGSLSRRFRRRFRQRRPRPQ